MYQPELGRFLQTDPIGFDAGDMNPFRYCGDDPVDKSDPTGLIMVDVTWSKQMWMQGGSQRSFNAILEKYRDQPAGNISSGLAEKDEGAKSATGRQDTVYHSFNDAAAAQKDAAYNMMSKEHEAGTEIWQKDDGSANYRSDKPRVTGDLYNVNDGKEKGKFLGFEPIAGRHPAGYHIAGWMYAHPFYRPEVPPHDQRRAYERGWNVYLVTPVRADRRLQNPGARNVVTYTYPAQPTD
jgi:uncharacterized protein RhaS with RHS repeats